MNAAEETAFPEYDYEALGLVAGLEIHQQLDTDTKLFCECPTVRREPEESVRSFTRYLHPTRSELGELDAAAVEESRVDREFEYLGFDTTCLVEEDEEPPHRLDTAALEVSLEIATLLEMAVVDQARLMRKIVVDGSNTSGFQRSTLVATEGSITTSEGEIGIADLLLEEESAARVETTDDGVTYALDRLGIPLVEIGTDPDIRTPEQAREAAEQLGMLLRSTGQVKRGLGTIRQDVNVSIAEGARIEIKGVQSLETIGPLVAGEVHRQVRLLDIATELRANDASVGSPTEVTELFGETDSAVLGDASSIQALPLWGFDGLLGAEIQPDRRLGTELSDHARRSGAGGLFHTDELPAYGISVEEVTALRERVGAQAGDAVALVAADEETAVAAIEAAAGRAATAIEGVPEETRGVNEDGTSRYLRPLPGAARMYPETDVPAVTPDTTGVSAPELLTERVERYRVELGLDAGLAEQVAFGRRMPVFETAIERAIDPTLAADTLTSTLTELRRDGVPVDQLTERHLLGTLELVDGGELAREGLDVLLREMAARPALTPQAAVDEAGLSGLSEADVAAAVEAVVEEHTEQIAEEGMGAFSALMGEVMAALRGKASGEVVSDLLRAAIDERT